MRGKWDAVVDVLVIGAGSAGEVAAIAAQEQGADVLILEKQPEGSRLTSTAMAGGAFLSPSDRKTALEHMDALCRVPTGESWTDREVLRAWVEYASTNIEWVEAHGGKARMLPDPGENVEIPGFQSLIKYRWLGLGYQMQRFLDDTVTAKKIPVQFSSPARRLITDSRGGVIGVEAARPGGNGAETVRIGAAKAVILACGGFEFDDALKLNYLPVHPTHFTGTPACTGDGLRMAMSVGADLWHMNCVSGRLVAKFPEYPMAFTVSLNAERRVAERSGADEVLLGPRPGYLMTDRSGKRYTNEEFKWHCVYYELTLFDTHMLAYPRVPTFWIFDRRRMELGTLVSIRSGATGPVRVYEWSKDNSRELERGWISTSNTVRGLAAKVGLPPENLEHTVTEYNKLCARGKDTEFGRKPEGLVPLDAPPFYAVKLWPGGPNTQGGPRRNARQQILNAEGGPIPGLYGAGELGSVYGMLYPGGGGNLTECLGLGRAAGENAASERRR